MTQTPEEKTLSIRDLAKDYKMSEKNLKTIIGDHNIPTLMVKGKTLVNVRAFDAWMAINLKRLSVENLETIERDDKNKACKIHPLLNEMHVLFNPPDLTKIQILKRLVDTLGDSKVVDKKNLPLILKAVIDRERLCSTAIMNGVAIPHPRSAMEQYIEKPALVLAISKRGIDFESDDGKKTHLFFLICAHSTDVHLKVMARLSRLLRSPKFRHELIISETFDQVVGIFEDWEKRLNLDPSK
jgi:PTS system nitrogen regulatory IIA component